MADERPSASTDVAKRTRPWKRRLAWLGATALLACVVVVAAHAPWSALGAPAGPLVDLLPNDVDNAVRFDPGAWSNSPIARELGESTLLDDLAPVGAVDASVLGRDVVFARRQGDWVTLFRAGSVGQVLRIGVSRAGAWLTSRTRPSASRVEEVETDEGDVLYVARHRDVFIVGDDEQLVLDALARADGETRSLVGATLDGELGTQARVWCSPDWSGEALDLVLPLFGRVGALVGEIVEPENVGVLSAEIELGDSTRPPRLVMSWTYRSSVPSALAHAAVRSVDELERMTAAIARPTDDSRELARGVLTLAPTRAAELMGAQAPIDAAPTDVTTFAEVTTTAARHGFSSLRHALVTPIAPAGAARDAVLFASVDFGVLASVRAASGEQTTQRRADELLRAEERSRRRRMTVRLAREGRSGDGVRREVNETIAAWRESAEAEALRIAAAEFRSSTALLERIGRVRVTLSRTRDGASLTLDQ